MQSLRDGRGDLSLNRKDISGSEFPIIRLGPKVNLGPGINKLSINADTIAGSLDTTFDNRGDAKLAADFLHAHPRV